MEDIVHNILIVGAGQLGSRHLQGALLSTFPLSISVVDPSEQSLSVAKERALQVQPSNKKSEVFYMSTLPEGQEIDICILSTSADIRADIARKIIAKNQVSHMVFEKVLFQKESDYFELEKLLEEKSVWGWVNCPRRVYGEYQEIRSSLDLSSPVEVSVFGSGWGMACNSVHFLDLFSYLIGDLPDINIKESYLDTEIIKSKRSGYYEVTGSITFQSEKHSIKVECTQEEGVELNVLIKNAGNSYFINEIGRVWEREVNGECCSGSYDPKMQSMLTGVYLDELLSSNVVGLTPFLQSCRVHTPFVKCLMQHFRFYLDANIDKCPIT
ncbi:Gfo/Idh/MocA family oxidoreductase [Marinomonas sp. CT5]|uniref:Gfo/Idh/MocA family oxidoreductase n=1 Tax=Marinomonas sp. CT5 TaxID=2066133 RepID=UPI001BAF1932|nr:Gfo/Idh/MocA family oxidoreductase [Marinomonas sp. CT5]